MWIDRHRMAIQINPGGVERPARDAKLARDQRFVGDRPNPDREVSLAMPEIDGAAAAGQFETDVGTGLAESRHAVGKEGTEPGRQRQPDAARARAGQGRHRLNGALQILAERQQPLAKRRHLDALRAAHHQRHPESGFQGRQSPAYRGVPHAQRARRARQRSLSRGGEKEAQIVPVRPAGCHHRHILDQPGAGCLCGFALACAKIANGQAAPSA